MTLKITEFGATIVRIAGAGERARTVELELAGRGPCFAAGQAVNVRLRTYAVGVWYSIASAPQEVAATGRLQLLVGVDGSRTPEGLSGMCCGTEVTLSQPAGGFGTSVTETPCAHVLFVAGGTGIAPVRSILSETLHRCVRKQLSLAYTARYTADLAFADEFRSYAARGQLQVVMATTRDAVKGALTDDLCVGRIDASRLRTLTPEPGATLCFVCGPPQMVHDVTHTLRHVGVPGKRIRREQLLGLEL